MPHDAAMDVRGLAHAFGDRTVLHDVAFSVQPGDFSVLLGLNGAGKTTLFALITRLYHSTAGTIAVFGHDTRQQPLAALARLGVVFQQQTLDLDLTVQQNLSYHAALHGLSPIAAAPRIAAELDRIGLLDRANERVRSLSGGQRRRVELARALLHQPSLLLLDEPTVGLDIESRRFLLDHVADLCATRGIGVLWATHLIDEVTDAARVIVLHHGRILVDGPRDDVIARANAADIATAFDHFTKHGQGVWPPGPPLTGDPHPPPLSTSDEVLPPPLLSQTNGGAKPLGLAWCLRGIIVREGWRWLNQRGRFVSALVRPLLWLIVFAAGFHFVLGVSIIPPYQTYIPYEVYIAPGLIGMIQLFNGMQSSLSMVYDREVGSMRTLMVSPFPRWFLLSGKLLASVAVSVVQVCIFLAIAWFWDITPPLTGYLAVIPALILSGLMLGALGLVLSSFIRQLENFAGVMNFVIFPMFFTSSALYPLWRVGQASPTIYWISQINPFTHAVELIRFALYDRFNAVSAAVVFAYLAVFMGLALIGYDPGRGLIARKGGE